jgi:hypothetical protein
MRQLIEKRLQLGDTPDNIRRLLEIPNIEDHPPPPMHNQDPLTATPLPLNKNILQHDAPIALYPDSPIDQQWDTNMSSMEYLTNPITTPSNNSTTHPGQFPFSNLSPHVSLNTATPYSLGPSGAYGTFSSNDHPSPSLAVFQPFDDNYLSQVQPFVDSSDPFLNLSGFQPT